MADYPVFKIAGRRVLNASFQSEDRTFPRLVEDCPNCSSTDTKPLSFNAKTLPHSVYECRVCAHVWRVLQADIARAAPIMPKRNDPRSGCRLNWVKSFVVTAIVAALCGTSLLFAQSIAGSQPNDYGDSKSWLCRPGRHDACDVDLTTTIVAADGALRRETRRPDPRAPIDCFYVYPTVSTDSTPVSDMNADLAELNVARLQFARFAEQCRLYAPLYRQVTLAAGRLRRAGGAPTNSLGIGYDDVLSAWNYYLQHDNQGRGVVLIGHSQGSTVLKELIRKEIDGKAVQSRLVSALLLGLTGVWRSPVSRTWAAHSSTCRFAEYRPRQVA